MTKKEKEISRRNFLGAALFGSIAAIVAVKSEAVAGNAFGGAYSSYPGTEPEIKIIVGDNPWFGEMLKMEIEKNDK